MSFFIVLLMIFRPRHRVPIARASFSYICKSTYFPLKYRHDSHKIAQFYVFFIEKQKKRLKNLEEQQKVRNFASQFRNNE